MKRLRFLTQKLSRLKQHYLWQDRTVYYGFILAAAFNLLLWIFIFYNLITDEAIIPLHYNVYFGVDLIGSKWQLLKLPFIGLIVLLINLFLSFKAYRYERVNSYFLIIGAVLVEFILLAAGFLIINL